MQMKNQRGISNKKVKIKNGEGEDEKLQKKLWRG